MSRLQKIRRMLREALRDFREHPTAQNHARVNAALSRVDAESAGAMKA